MHVKGAERLESISPKVSWAQRIGFKEISDRFEKSGRKAYKLMGANVGTWGYSNPTLTNMLVKAAEADWGSHYLDATGILEDLKESIAYFEKNVRGVSCDADQIIPVAGVKGGWNILHYSLLDPGDELICLQPAHYYLAPARYLSYYGAKALPCLASESEGWEPDVDDLRSKISRRTKAIVMDYPNNPTGAVYPEKVLKQIIDVAGEHNLLLISDEIYGLILLDGQHVKSLLSLAKDVPAISMYSTSKWFLNPGWRLGYIHLHDPAGNMKDFTKTLKIVAATYGFSEGLISTPIAAAGVGAFRGPYKYSYQFVTTLRKTRDYVIKRLAEVDGVTCVKPQAGMYAFPNVERIAAPFGGELPFLTQLAKEEGVAFYPGSQFGIQGTNHFRTLLLPSMQDQQEIFDRFLSFVERHSRVTQSVMSPRRSIAH